MKSELENPNTLVKELAKAIREHVYSERAQHYMINIVSALAAYRQTLQDDLQEARDRVAELEDELQAIHRERYEQ